MRYLSHLLHETKSRATPSRVPAWQQTPALLVREEEVAAPSIPVAAAHSGISSSATPWLQQIGDLNAETRGPDASSGTQGFQSDRRIGITRGLQSRRTEAAPDGISEEATSMAASAPSSSAGERGNDARGHNVAEHHLSRAIREHGGFESVSLEQEQFESRSSKSHASQIASSESSSAKPEMMPPQTLSPEALRRSEAWERTPVRDVHAQDVYKQNADVQDADTRKIAEEKDDLDARVNALVDARGTLSTSRSSRSEAARSEIAVESSPTDSIFLDQSSRQMQRAAHSPAKTPASDQVTVTIGNVTVSIEADPALRVASPPPRAPLPRQPVEDRSYHSTNRWTRRYLDR